MILFINSKICGSQLQVVNGSEDPYINENENGTVAPGKLKIFELIYKIPVASTPKELDYFLSGTGYPSGKNRGKLSLR